jgi:Ca2+-dependent lipid-binding protein
VLIIKCSFVDEHYPVEPLSHSSLDHHRQSFGKIMGVLTVVLRKIDHLRDEDTLGKSDPYVKFHLEQDNWILDKNLGRHSSSKKKNDCNPVYNETFTFDDVDTLNNLRLHIRGE